MVVQPVRPLKAVVNGATTTSRYADYDQGFLALWRKTDVKHTGHQRLVNAKLNRVAWMGESAVTGSAIRLRK